jgi:hypothetical protein
MGLWGLKKYNFYSCTLTIMTANCNILSLHDLEPSVLICTFAHTLHTYAGEAEKYKQVVRTFFFRCCLTQFLCQTIFISLIVDEDENDYSYVAMKLQFGVRLTCHGHTPQIMVLTKSGNYVHL